MRKYGYGAANEQYLRAAKQYLPQIMELLVGDIEKINASYKTRYGEPVYEHFLYRIKSKKSMCEKCFRNGLYTVPESALLKIHDSIGLRIVCNFIDDIYEMVKSIKDIPYVTVAEEKDYIRNVKANGYRSYHIVLLAQVPFKDVQGHIPGKYYVEVQIRTIAMDSWAAQEHRIKYKRNISEANLELITAELKHCADNLASCDLNMQTIQNMIRAKESVYHKNLTGGG